MHLSSTLELVTQCKVRLGCVKRILEVGPRQLAQYQASLRLDIDLSNPSLAQIVASKTGELEEKIYKDHGNAEKGRKARQIYKVDIIPLASNKVSLVLRLIKMV